MGILEETEAAKETALSDEGPSDFLIIIGAMKSGTTSLFRLLAQHPQIARSSDKEPDFFSTTSKWNEGLDFYRKLWTWRPGLHQVALEASTSYTKYPFDKNVPERMASLEGCSFRFVYLIRNPFDRIESHIRHGLYKGWNPSLDHGLTSSYYPIELTRYAKQIDRYLAHFPRADLLVCTLDELKSQPADVLRRVCVHAGVDPDFEFKQPEKVANPGTRYQRKGWINRFEESQSTPARALKHVLKSVVGTKRLQSLLNSTAGEVELGRYKLTPEERELVLEFLADDLRRVRDEHSIDIEGLWGINV